MVWRAAAAAMRPASNNPRHSPRRNNHGYCVPPQSRTSGTWSSSACSTTWCSSPTKSTRCARPNACAHARLTCRPAALCGRDGPRRQPLCNATIKTFPGSHKTHTPPPPRAPPRLLPPPPGQHLCAQPHLPLVQKDRATAGGALPARLPALDVQGLCGRVRAAGRLHGGRELPAGDPRDGGNFARAGAGSGEGTAPELAAQRGQRRRAFALGWARVRRHPGTGRAGPNNPRVCRRPAASRAPPPPRS